MFMPHVTIYTAKMEESIAFYRNFAKLDVVDDRRPASPIVFLANQPGETRVELIETPVEKAYHGDGIAIGFRCENVEDQHARMAAWGLNPTDFICPSPDVKFFFVKDPNGVTVQLIRG